MEIIGKKARAAAFVSAVGLMVIGLVSTTSISAHENLTPIKVEVVPPGEPEMIRQVANFTRELQDKRRKFFPLQKGKALRGVHPKSHGCVAADFTVLKYIGREFKVGLFAEPRTYKAMIRYSNASVLQLPDLKGGNGSRGMAIKVIDVNDTTLYPDKNEISGEIEQNQDFLMINTPEFAFANVRDYLRLTRVLMKHPVGADPRPYFFPAQFLKLRIMDLTGKLSPPKKGESLIVSKMRSVFNGEQFKDVFGGFSSADVFGTKLSAEAVEKIKKKTVRNPIKVQYFSAAPFRFGSEQVMKFSVVPSAGEAPQAPFSPEEIGSLNENYLAQALTKYMAQTKARGKKIHLSFMIQTAEESQLSGRKKDMIENAAIAWSEKEFPLVKVAHIVIDPAKQKYDKFVDACKSLRFTPWHALAAHEPLGGINRMRKPIYCESGKFRPDGKDPSQVLCRGKEYGTN